MIRFISSSVAVCFFAAFFVLLSNERMLAQCSPDEVEVTFILTTDAWGYEIYWELYPEGSSCGESPILSGGNALQVGCDGGGQQNATGGNGYPSNSQIELDPICLQTDEPLVFQFIDDWGDGGLNVQIYEDGNFVTSFQGSGNGNVWSYTPGSLVFPVYNNPCGALEVEIDGDAIVFSNVAANVFPGEPAPPGGGCQTSGLWCEGGLSNTIWAYIVAPESGSLEFSTCMSQTNFDTQLAVWKATDCGDYSTFELIAANDDIPGGCGPGNGFASRTVAACLEPGEPYYIQIDGYNGATGTSGLRVSTINTPITLAPNVNSMPCAIGKGEPGEGSIQMFVNGYGINFTTVWEGPNGFASQSNNINNLEVGTYTATVTTNCGTELTGSFDISVPQPIFVTLSLTQPDCALSPNGGAAAAITGGTAPFSYEWEGPDNYSSDDNTPDDMFEGAYTLLITDANGCEMEQGFTLTAANAIGLDLGPNQTICTDETLLLFAPAGYEYEWQDGSINQFYYVEGEDYEIGDHIFVVEVFNDEGCEAIDAVTVTIELCSNIEDVEHSEPAIYPNPFNEMVYIDLNVDSPVDLEVFDSVGKRVIRTQIQGQNIQYSTADLARGIYIFQISGEGFQATHRLVKH